MNYVLSASSEKSHLPGCSSIDCMAKENKRAYTSVRVSWSPGRRRWRGRWGEVVFGEAVSPNEDYASSEENVVYGTARVLRDGSGTATVSAESNPVFFNSVSYEIECGGSSGGKYSGTCAPMLA